MSNRMSSSNILLESCRAWNARRILRLNQKQSVCRHRNRNHATNSSPSGCPSSSTTFPLDYHGAGRLSQRRRPRQRPRFEPDEICLALQPLSFQGSALSSVIHMGSAAVMRPIQGLRSVTTSSSCNSSSSVCVRVSGNTRGGIPCPLWIAAVASGRNLAANSWQIGRWPFVSYSSTASAFAVASATAATTAGRKQVNVGQGVNQDRKVVVAEGLNPAQRKAAEVQLQSMEQSTKRILQQYRTDKNHNMLNNLSSGDLDSWVNEIRVAIHFWSNKWIVHFHPLCSVYPTHVTRGLRSPIAIDAATSTHTTAIGDPIHGCYGDYGPKVAEELLHVILDMHQHYPQHNILQRVLTRDGNVAIANIVYGYLLPCAIHASSHTWQLQQDGESQGDQHSHVPKRLHANNDYHGDHYDYGFTQYSTSTGRHNINVPLWTLALEDAFRVMDLLEGLVADDDCPVQHDAESNNAVLYAWMKLAILRNVDVGVNAAVGEGIESESTLQQQQQSGPCVDVTPNQDDKRRFPTSLQLTKSLSQVIDSMETKLKDMEDVYFQTKSDTLKPNVYSYNHVLRALTLGGSDALERVNWYLERMEKTEDDDNKKTNNGKVGYGNSADANDNQDLPPTTAFADAVSYNLVIHTLSSSIAGRWIDGNLKVQMARNADSLLERAETRYQLYKRSEAKPTTITYANVLKAWANAGRAPDAERILEKMIALSGGPSQSTADDVKPNLICFNTVVDAWAKTKGQQAAENALRIMKRMEELSKLDEYHDIYPDTITYSSVIAAFARSGREDAGDRAEELLERSLSLFHDGKKDLRPDSMTFCSVLDALSKQSKFDHLFPSRKCSIRRAEQIFERMKKLHHDSNSTVRPNTVAYNILIGMYASARKVEEAKKLFDEMHSSTSLAKPDLITYNSYIYALANSHEREHVDSALTLLNEMENDQLSEGSSSINPDTSSYMSVMKALSKKSREDSKAIHDMENILRSMERRFINGESTVQPVNVFYNCYIDALAKSGLRNAFDQAILTIDHMKKLSNDWGSKELLPDTISYTIVMNALANYQGDVSYRAEEILKLMEDAGVKPNRYTYNSFINCLARSRKEGTPERAEEVLMKMYDLSDSKDADMRPDVYTFASVINCWANSHSKVSAERAQRILDLMESRCINGQEHLRPTLFTYGAVLNAWAKSGCPSAPQRARQILDKIEKRYSEGDGTMRPNGAIYNSVINAIAKSESPRKAEEAEAMLQRMRDSFRNGNHDAKPNVRTLSTILNACAYTNGEESIKLSAFSISRKIFKEILNGNDVNQIVFATFIKCCALIPPSNQRDMLVESTFNECRQRGMVDVKVILGIRRCLSRSRLLDLLDGTSLASGIISINDIPNEWRRKIQ